MTAETRRIRHASTGGHPPRFAHGEFYAEEYR